MEMKLSLRGYRGAASVPVLRQLLKEADCDLDPSRRVDLQVDKYWDDGFPSTATIPIQHWFQMVAACTAAWTQDAVYASFQPGSKRLLIKRIRFSFDSLFHYFVSVHNLLQLAGELAGESLAQHQALLGDASAQYDRLVWQAIHATGHLVTAATTSLNHLTKQYKQRAQGMAQHVRWRLKPRIASYPAACLSLVAAASASYLHRGHLRSCLGNALRPRAGIADRLRPPQSSWRHSVYYDKGFGKRTAAYLSQTLSATKAGAARIPWGSKRQKAPQILVNEEVDPLALNEEDAKRALNVRHKGCVL